MNNEPIVYVSYAFFLENSMGEPTSYGGCESHDIMISRYNELSKDPLTGKNGVIVIENTHTVTSRDITKELKK